MMMMMIKSPSGWLAGINLKDNSSGRRLHHWAMPGLLYNKGVFCFVFKKVLALQWMHIEHPMISLW